MEIRNFVNKIIPGIDTGVNVIITDQSYILQETKLFYDKLYMENENITDINLDDELQNYEVQKLSDQERERERQVRWPNYTS